MFRKTSTLITLVFIASTQVGHVESVDLGDITRKRITRAMKPPIFGKKQDMQACEAELTQVLTCGFI